MYSKSITKTATPSPSPEAVSQEIGAMISGMKTRLSTLYAEASADDPLAFADEMQPILANRRDIEISMQRACDSLMAAAGAYETMIAAVNAKIAPAPVAAAPAAPAALAAEGTAQTSLFCDTVKASGIAQGTRYSQKIGDDLTANAILHADGRMTILAGSAISTAVEGATKIKNSSYRQERMMALNASRPCEHPDTRILIRNVTVQSAASAATILNGSTRAASTWRADDGSKAPKTRGFEEETRSQIRNWVNKHVPDMVEEFTDEFCNKRHRILFRAPHRKAKLAKRECGRYSLTATRLRRMAEADQVGFVYFLHGETFYDVPLEALLKVIGDSENLTVRLIKETANGTDLALEARGNKIGSRSTFPL
ncbi:hypothetical protein AB9K35_17025 [Leisingera sp. XS_AS12]|uniref:hypothetical protein n=1 Tax=Leisingera sp. XS_AS12 TaxID=3241294 RepID=UPI003518193D